MSEPVATPVATEPTVVPPSAPSPEPSAGHPPTEGGATPKPEPVRGWNELRARNKSGNRAPVEAAQAVVPDVPAPDGAGVTIDAQGKAHGPDGKFVSPPGEGVAPETASAEGATAEGAEGTPSVSETVRIAIPENHPLRERGLTELPFDVPKEFEAEMKATLNGAVRAKQVAEAERRARQAEERAIRLEAAQRWQAENPGKLTPEQELLLSEMSSDPRPEIRAQVEDLRQRLLDQSRGDMESAVEAEVQEQRNQKLQTVALQFRTHAMTDAAARFPGWRGESAHLLTLQQMGQASRELPQPGSLQEALVEYGAVVQVKTQTDPSYMPNARDWLEVANRVYARSPQGQAEAKARADQQAQADAQAKADAEAERQRREEEAAAIAARNPLGSAPRRQQPNTHPSAQAGTGLPKPGQGNYRDFRKGLSARRMG